MKDSEQVWAVVPPEIYAEIESIRDKAEQEFWVRPPRGAVVLSLIKAGLEARKTTTRENT